jgi:ribosomal protein S18 acetylase RimI-like enzyme
MDKVFYFNDIQDIIKKIKGLNTGYITNFYLEVDRINALINKNQFYKKIIGNTAFFFKDDYEFIHLFYCSSSIDELDKSLTRLRTEMDKYHLVVDIIGKQPNIQSIAYLFKMNGFFEYTVLNRMSRISIQDMAVKSQLNLKIDADSTNCKQIFDLLHQYFDPIAEQLPDLDEIKNWAKSNHLLFVEENGEISGFVIFDLIGVTSYLRYWFVHPKHRNKKIGSILLNEYFKRSEETKRQIFWVIQSNDNAIKRYLHYGFQSENLYDIIVTNNNIKYETTNN